MMPEEEQPPPAQHLSLAHNGVSLLNELALAHNRVGFRGTILRWDSVGLNSNFQAVVFMQVFNYTCRGEWHPSKKDAQRDTIDKALRKAIRGTAKTAHEATLFESVVQQVDIRQQDWSRPAAQP